jgi:hypothetical protein
VAVSKALFVERFLVRPSGPMPPQPAAYDESRGYSVTADGRPFIEAGAASVGTVTLTEAPGETDDEDPDGDDELRLCDVTKTQAPGEAEDFHRAGLSLHTDTKTSGERPDVDAWAHTETRASGEPPDHHIWASTVTMTFVHNEAVDEDED